MPSIGHVSDIGQPSISFPLVSRGSSKPKQAECVASQPAEQVLVDRPVIHVIPVYIIIVVIVGVLSTFSHDAMYAGIIIFTPVWSVAIFIHMCSTDKIGLILGSLLFVGWPVIALLDDMGYTICYILIFTCFVSDHFWELRGLALVTSSVACAGLLGGTFLLQKGNPTMPLVCSSSLVLAVMCSRRLSRIRYKIVLPRIPVNEPV